MAARSLPLPSRKKSMDDLGAPSELGAPMPRARQTAAPPALPPDLGPDIGEAPPARSGAGVTPEALHYHDDEQRCDGCTHMGSGNHCDLLQMPVEPEGGCIGFSATDMGGAPEVEPEEGTGDEDDLEDEDDEEAYAPLGAGNRRGGYGS